MKLAIILSLLLIGGVSAATPEPVYICLEEGAPPLVRMKTVGTITVYAKTFDECCRKLAESARALGGNGILYPHGQKRKDDIQMTASVVIFRNPYLLRYSGQRYVVK